MAAAAILIGLVAGLAWSGSSGEGSGVYAQYFLSRAVEEDALETGDVRALTAFFRREMGVPVEPVQLASTPPSRAMICLIDGRRAAMVEYEIEGYTLAHYQIPLEGRRPRASAGLRMSEENGVCVYRWSDGRFEHALVSDMPAARLRQIAETGFLSSGGTSP